MLRLGCFGCLTTIVLIAVVAAVAWGIAQAARPPDITGVPTSAADGLRAQQKIFEVLRRGAEGRARTVALTEGEVNAFLSRHLQEAGDLPLRNLAVRLPSDARAEISGQLPLAQLLAMPPASAVAAIIPGTWLRRDVWVSVRARVSLEGGERVREPRRLRLDVERFSIGRLPLPEVMLRVLLDPAALRLLRAPLPDAITGLRTEGGRLVIQSGS